ncbi:MAG: hypothetical protein Q7L07_04945 [Pseudohongiella sp.]|nr:hypothetical protein [Pseudohongiella sp.]
MMTSESVIGAAVGASPKLAIVTVQRIPCSPLSTQDLLRLKSGPVTGLGGVTISVAQSLLFDELASGACAAF